MGQDNGLFIVIKGDHCGKYVLRIHHQYDGNVVIAILAVVHRVAGLVDNLTGDLLELDASHLCACEVSKEVGFQLHHSFGERTSDRRGPVKHGSIIMTSSTNLAHSYGLWS